MRMRKKPNLIPRMERCAALQITQPETLRGRWGEEFSQYKAIRLEIGCGKGRFTCLQALAEPEILLVAVEKVPDAMVVAEERALEQGIANIRFIDFDAEKLTEIFAPGEVERIYINFPDPWRKTRQYKRRLTAPAFLERYTQVMPIEGEVWFKTDNEPLFAWSMESFAQNGWSVRPMPDGTPMTDYELKFTEQGLPIHRIIATQPPKKEQE